MVAAGDDAEARPACVKVCAAALRTRRAAFALEEAATALFPPTVAPNRGPSLHARAPMLQICVDHASRWIVQTVRGSNGRRLRDAFPNFAAEWNEWDEFRRVRRKAHEQDAETVEAAAVFNGGEAGAGGGASDSGDESADSVAEAGIEDGLQREAEHCGSAGGSAGGAGAAEAEQVRGGEKPASHRTRRRASRWRSRKGQGACGGATASGRRWHREPEHPACARAAGAQPRRKPARAAAARRRAHGVDEPAGLCRLHAAARARQARGHALPPLDDRDAQARAAAAALERQGSTLPGAARDDAGRAARRAGQPRGARRPALAPREATVARAVWAGVRRDRGAGGQAVIVRCPRSGRHVAQSLGRRRTQVVVRSRVLACALLSTRRAAHPSAASSPKIWFDG
eukprot:3472735-Prymnesium_polylepis.1